LIFGRSHHGLVRIDLKFDLMTVDGGVFNAYALLGRPTILRCVALLLHSPKCSICSTGKLARP